MTQTHYVQGAGGEGKGGGGQRTPVEEDDTLQSKQFATVVDLISEGEIEGFDSPNDYKSVFLDNTPVQFEDSNGTLVNNFQGYSIATRLGTQGQTHLPASFGTPAQPKIENVEVTNGVPHTVSTTKANVDRVRVTLRLPALQRMKDDGDIVGHKVRIRIQVKYADQSYFSTVINDKISGKSSSSYERDYLIDLTGALPAEIRMVRVSADETTQKKASSTFFHSFTEIVDKKFSYPNSAVVGLRVDASQFSSIPARKYLIRGIKVKIPSNATVDTTTHIGRLTYSGIWDGTFAAATWCNDPAWCLHDLLTSERYGAGVPENTLDRYDFYAISQYCNALVDDGNGGQEPRFSLNMLINSRDEVYNVIQQMTAIFRGIAYYGAGALQLLQDKPADPFYLISPSNVVDGLFEYQGSSKNTRHTVAVVAWQSYDTRGDVQYEYVEDHAGVAKYGIVKKDIKAIGCYSQGQANRIGKWALLSEQNLTESIQFSVSIETGIILRPGMVIDVADPMRAGVRRSGRIKSATTSVLTVDNDLDLFASTATSDNSPTVSVMMPTGLVETRAIPAGGIKPQADGTATIEANEVFSEAPAANAIFLVQTSDPQAQQFRVVSVTEAEDGVYGVSAIAYNSTIYDAVERGIDLTNRDISTLSAIPAAVTDVVIEDFLYQEGSSVFVGASVSWTHDRKNLSGFQLQYRIDEDNWRTIETSSPSVTLRNLRAGTLTVQIQAKNYINKRSTITIKDAQIKGKSAAPANVTGFSMIPVNGQARLSWDQSTDLDVRVGGYVRLRHSPDLSGVTWATSTSISEQIAGSATEAYADLKPGTYSIKFVDSGGRESLDAGLIEFTKPDLSSVEVIGALGSTEQASFTGTKTNLVVDTQNSELTLAETTTELPAVDSFLLEDGNKLKLEDESVLKMAGPYAINQSGTYVFNGGNSFALSDVFSLKLDSTVKARSFYPYGEHIDDEPDFDAIVNFDGSTPSTCDVKLFIRTTQDDPSGVSPTFTSWRRFNNAEFKARGYQVKAEVSTGGPQEQVAISQLEVQAQMPVRSLTGSVQTNANGNVSVAYGAGNKFYVTPSVGIVFTTNASGDYYVISNSSATGFDVSVYDSNDTRIAKEVNWTATGYGIG